MTESNIVNLSNQQDYKAYRLNLDKKPSISFLIHRKCGDIISFPYLFMPPCDLVDKGSNRGEISFSGGGMSFTIHFESLPRSEKVKFMQSIADRTLYEMSEFSGDASRADFPVIAKIEQF